MRQWILQSILASVALGGLATTMSGQTSRADGHLTVFGGPAFQTGAASRPFELGISGDATVFRARSGAFGAGLLAEGGLYHPALSGKGNYYFSADAILDLAPRMAAREALKLRPFAAAGYTRRFNATDTAIGTSDGVNYGVGLDRAIGDDLSLRLEVRDCYMPANDSHALVLRFGLVALLSLQ